MESGDQSTETHHSHPPPLSLLPLVCHFIRCKGPLHSSCHLCLRLGMLSPDCERGRRLNGQEVVCYEIAVYPRALNTRPCCV